MEVFSKPPFNNTSEDLERERKRASFDSRALRYLLSGGEEAVRQTEQWQKLFNIPVFDMKDDPFLSRTEYFRKVVERGMTSYRLLRENPELLAAHSPAHGGGRQSVGQLSDNHFAVGSDHFGLFVPTLMSQATLEQQKEWLIRAMRLQIIGCYAQTELGHGSNVRGLETTAEYDKQTDEFVINSPTVTALKWWPGALGVLCTHALIYARLILDGKDLGFHSFVIQLRDENHRPLPGVVVGDLGPKMGYNYNDNGFCGFQNVRIPRFNMLAKFQHINDKGEYVKPPKALSKIGYLTMTRTRVNIVRGAYAGLAKACCIAIRYNAVRRQGFKEPSDDIAKAIDAGENTILDYPIQQYRLFTNLACTYAFNFVSSELSKTLHKFDALLKENPESVGDDLPELHALSAGLKAFTTDATVEGIEEVRKCCGGHGYALAGGIGTHLMNFIPNVTFEGDKIPMALQTARFLVQQFNNAKDGKPLTPSSEYLGRASPVPSVDINSPEQILKLFELVAYRVVERAAHKLKDERKTKSHDAAWSACHLQLVNAAHHHVILTTLRGFVTGVAKIKEPSIRSALAPLVRLYAFYMIKKGDTADWVGILSMKDQAAIEDGVAKCLGEIRPNAVALVDAFGFTDRNLYDSAIGREDGNIYPALVDHARRNPMNDEAFQQSIFKDHLSKVLDGEYLKQSRQKQRQVTTQGKL